MAKFMMLYKGNATPPENMSEDQAKAEMAKWGAWMEQVGDSMLDVGQPMDAAGVSLVDDGSTGKVETPLNGYSIVEANDMTAAQKLADNHPFLSEGQGNFSIELYELQPVPGM